MRRRMAVLSSSIAVIAGTFTAVAWAGGPDSIVRAHSPDDGQTVIRSAVRVSQTGAETVDSSNLAEAYAHDCTGCEAIATSFQAVVATGTPSTVTPTNSGVAVTYQCTGCKVFAYAYQYVVTTDRHFRADRDDRVSFGKIREEARDLTREGLPYAELDVRLHELAKEFRAAVDRALAEQDVDSDGDSDEDRDAGAGVTPAVT